MSHLATKARITEGVSYSDAVIANTHQCPPKTNTMSPAEMLASFITMYAQMQELAHKLSEIFTTSLQHAK